MKFRGPLKILLPAVLLLSGVCVHAQIPYETVLDSAEMRKMRDQKVMYKYNIIVKFDSVTGKLPKNPKPDTVIRKYDKTGREVEFSYMNSKDERWYNYKFYDQKGRVVRKLSCNRDSSQGFVDYWTYNDRGLVATERSYTREGRKEVLFKTEEFIYDKDGRLTEQRDYNGTIGSSTFETSRFSYEGNWTIRTEFRENGDTSHVDSTLTDAEKNTVYSAYYAYFKSWNGKYSKRLVGIFECRRESLGSRQRTITGSRYFSYADGSLSMAYADTTLSDRNDNILESRADHTYTKYFWNDDGTFDYSIQYNRRNQPLEKRTTAYRYYE